MPVTIYGIKNCDTMKKALAWLDAHGVAHVFHDYRAAGMDRNRLTQWCEELGWETLLNRAGTTFRALPESGRQNLNASKAIKLMLAQPSMIKRPVLDLGHSRVAGFKPDLYAQLFGPESAADSKKIAPRAGGRARGADAGPGEGPAGEEPRRGHGSVSRHSR